LLPTFDGGEDAFGIGSPEEGLGIIVCLGDEALDGGFEVGDGSEDAALEALPCELAEEALSSSAAIGRYAVSAGRSASPARRNAADGGPPLYVRVATARQRNQLPPNAQYWVRSAQAWLADLRALPSFEEQ
jgi:hypothetical protein